MARGLHSVVIKEDPAEQFSPSFAAKRGFFQMNSNLQQSGPTLNRNIELSTKQRTFRELERERLNNESQNSRGGSVTKININFNGDQLGNPMTSSGTNLAILGGGSPKEEQKMQLNKMYSGNGGIFGGLNNNKKTL